MLFILYANKCVSKSYKEATSNEIPFTYLKNIYQVPIVCLWWYLPSWLYTFFCGTGRQVKQYTVYDKNYICYDWNMHHRICETGRGALRSGRSPGLTQIWVKTRQMDITIIKIREKMEGIPKDKRETNENMTYLRNCKLFGVQGARDGNGMRWGWWIF